MSRPLILKIWLFGFACLLNIVLFVSVQQALAGPPVSTAGRPLPQATPSAATPPPAETATPPPPPLQLWLNHQPGTALVNALLVEGDYLWTATNGEGVIRWNRHNATFVQYNRANGLIDNKVRAIAIDPAGHKWFGTENGVSEFDGRVWTNYTTASGLAHPKVVAIAVDAAGHKWFGTWGGGLSYFDGQTWTTYTRSSGLASNYIHALAVDPSNHIWVATPHGVNEFDGRQWRTYTAADGLGSDWVHAIAIDQAGHQWFGTTAGLSEFDGQSWRTYTTTDGLVSNAIRAIAIDRFGYKWIATAYGLSRFDGQVWTTYNRANGLPHSHLTSIAFDPAGVAWLGTLEGVIEFDQGRVTLHTIGALGGNRVRAITIDPAGSKWFGTNRGVSRFDDHTWTSYTTAQGLVDNDVRAIAIESSGQNPMGRVWVGTAKGVSALEGQKWLTYTVSDGLVHPQVNAIAIDAQGHKWFGTAGGVSEFDGRTWRSYTTTHGLVNDQVTAMVIDPTGTKWFGTAGGISRFDGQTWSSYTTTHGLPDAEVISLAVDQAGQVWAIFDRSGVRRFDGQTWIDDIKREDQMVVPDYHWWVQTIAIDQMKRRWFGTYEGLLSFDGQTLTTFTHAAGLASDKVSVVAVEANGKVWVGTDGAGVSEGIAPAEISPAVSAPPATPVTATPLAVTLTPPASLTPTQDVPLPALLLQLPLAPPSHTLSNIQLDSGAGRLYVTDSNRQLHILETQSYQHLATLPQVNELILDTPHQRLYTINEKELIVRDAATLTVLETIAPPGRVIFNHDQHQVYIANRIYDAVTLKRIGLLPENFSDYNPARNEIYFYEGSGGTDFVYSVDPETFQLTGDLLPDVSAHLNASFYVSLQVFPEQNWLLINSYLNSAGHGSGENIPPRFKDATTLDEFTDWEHIPELEVGCDNHRPIFAQPVNGLIYRGRYLRKDDSPNDNLLVYDLDGHRVTWRDGLKLGRTNPNTNQMYLENTVYDLATLSPVGQFPISGATICVIDNLTGRIYANQAGNLIVMAERGGQLKPLSLPEPVGTPSTDSGSNYAFFVQLSPNYIQDHTLFIGTEGMLYRSRNGGQTWVRLHGGLPDKFIIYPENFAISPNFATDQTLFASGRWKPGIYRSTDGGDTWQPLWNGLTHLRVRNLLISPNYASDSTILAAARYLDIERREEGLSIFSSNSNGLSWTQVFTGYPFSNPEQIYRIMTGFLPPSPGLSSTRFRWLDYSTIERTVDNGRTWQSITETFDTEQGLNAVVSSPNFVADRTAYGGDSRTVFRTTDAGDTWQPIKLPVAANFLGVPVYFSPNFGSDHTLYLIADQNVFRSGDGGQTWKVITPSGETKFFDTRLQFAPSFTTNHTLFLVMHQNLFRSTNDGDTWGKIIPLGTTPSAFPIAFYFSPNFKLDRTLYLTSGPDLFRSTDGGDSWERWHYELTNPTEESYTLAIKAISPVLTDGTYRLFISSDYAGQFWALDPVTAKWETVETK